MASKEDRPSCGRCIRAEKYRIETQVKVSSPTSSYKKGAFASGLISRKNFSRPWKRCSAPSKLNTVGRVGRGLAVTEGKDSTRTGKKPRVLPPNPSLMNSACGRGFPEIVPTNDGSQEVILATVFVLASVEFVSQNGTDSQKNATSCQCLFSWKSQQTKCFSHPAVSSQRALTVIFAVSRVPRKKETKNGILPQKTENGIFCEIHKKRRH